MARMIVTADHGNADLMYELDKKTGEVLTKADGSPRAKTSHTLNPVPCHVFAPGVDLAIKEVERPGLANVAASLLFLMGREAPEGYLPSFLEAR